MASAGLASALALFRHLCAGRNAHPKPIAVTGSLTVDSQTSNSTTRIGHSSHLGEKLLGLIREAPWIKEVIVPKENSQDIPIEVMEQLDVFQVGNLEEARTVFCKHCKECSDNRWSGDSSPHPGFDSTRTAAALDLPIGSKLVSIPTFRTRLVYRFPMPEGSLLTEIPGWTRETNYEDEHSFLSGCDIATNVRMKEATENVLTWRDDEEGTPIPLVHKLDIEKYTENRNWLDRANGFRLTGADFIPVQNGRVGLLGFVFQGQANDIRQYLDWASSRMFGRQWITNQQGTKKTGFQFGTIVRELRQAIIDNRSPVVPEGEGRSKGRPHLFQYVLVPEDFSWPASGNQDKVFETASALLSSVSRPKSGYPKDDPRSFEFWTHPQARKTRYCIHENAVTSFASASEEFNRSTKMKIFLEANYMQWVVAQEARKIGKDVASLRKYYTLDVRKAFFDHCCRFLSRD